MHEEDHNSSVYSDASNSSLSSKEYTEEDLKKIAYNQSFLAKATKIAFLYRSEELDKQVNERLELTLKLQKEYTQKFIASLKEFINSKFYEDAAKKTEFIDKERSEAKRNELLIYDDVTKIVEDCLAQVVNISDPTQIEQLITDIFIKKIKELLNFNRNQAYVLACKEYFNKDYEFLGKEGMVYEPPKEVHKWIYNANWLLGHFNKGTDTFVVKSAITEENKLRKETSESTGDLGSGFFREIAICAQLGYELKLDDQHNVILKHNNPAILQRITLEEIMSISTNDMVPSYDKIMENYYKLTQSHRLTVCVAGQSSSSIDEQVQSSGLYSDAPETGSPPAKKSKTEEKTKGNEPKSSSSSLNHPHR